MYIVVWNKIFIRKKLQKFVALPCQRGPPWILNCIYVYYAHVFQKTVKGMNTKLALIYQYYMYPKFVRRLCPYNCCQTTKNLTFYENLCKIDPFPWLLFFFSKIALTK